MARRVAVEQGPDLVAVGGRQHLLQELVVVKRHKVPALCTRRLLLLGLRLLARQPHVIGSAQGFAALPNLGAHDAVLVHVQVAGHREEAAMIVHLDHAAIGLVVLALGRPIRFAAQEEKVQAVAGGRDLGVGVRRIEHPAVALCDHAVLVEHVVEVESRDVLVIGEHEADAVEPVSLASGNRAIEACPGVGAGALGIAAGIGALGHLGWLAIALFERPADPAALGLESVGYVLRLERHNASMSRCLGKYRRRPTFTEGSSPPSVRR